VNVTYFEKGKCGSCPAQRLRADPDLFRPPRRHSQTRLGQLLYRAGQRNDRRKNPQQASLQTPGRFSLLVDKGFLSRKSSGSSRSVSSPISATGPNWNHCTRCHKNAAERNFFFPVPSEGGSGHLFFLRGEPPKPHSSFFGDRQDAPPRPDPSAGQWCGRMLFSLPNPERERALLLFLSPAYRGQGAEFEEMFGANQPDAECGMRMR